MKCIIFEEILGKVRENLYELYLLLLKCILYEINIWLRISDVCQRKMNSVYYI